jgi:hypothetical protein
MLCSIIRQLLEFMAKNSKKVWRCLVGWLVDCKSQWENRELRVCHHVLETPIVGPKSLVMDRQ